MADTTLKESGTDIVKRIRATLEFNVHIRPITQETVREFYKNETDEEIYWEIPERQNRLLLALLSDKEALKKYLTYIFMSDLEYFLDSDSAGKVEDQDEEILEPIYSRMNEEDAQFFKEVREDGIFFDNIAHIQKAFFVKWDETEIIGLDKIE